MHLRDWLEREGLNFPEFGALIGRTAQAVQRYVSGTRIPDRETMPLIVGATKGEVTANDFYGICSIHTAPDTIGADVVSSGKSGGITAQVAA